MKDYKEAINPQEKIDNTIDLELALNDLEKEEKLIVILYYEYGYSTKEIANIMDENINTLKSKLLRARRKIHIKGKEEN